MALLEDIVDFCKKELNIPQEILVSVEVEDISEDNVKGWTTDSAEDDEYENKYGPEDTGTDSPESVSDGVSRAAFRRRQIRHRLRLGGVLRRFDMRVRVRLPQLQVRPPVPRRVQRSP